MLKKESTFGQKNKNKFKTDKSRISSSFFFFFLGYLLKMTGVPTVVQWVTDPALPLWWLRFNPGPSAVGQGSDIAAAVV